VDRQRRGETAAQVDELAYALLRRPGDGAPDELAVAAGHRAGPGADLLDLAGFRRSVAKLPVPPIQQS